MTTVNSDVAADGAEDDSRPKADPRRWWVLALLSGLQFMILLDMTVVNVALPLVQDSLGFSEAGLTWVVNGYVLAAGGLLILGGRLADVFGRRRLLLTGVGIFAVSSAVCGAAVVPGMMVVGRFAQGAAEAIAAPASLGLIALLFTDPKERNKALGIWGGLVALGGTLGYIVSGVLTDLTSWRWLFYINLPVALAVLVAIPRMVTESRMEREKDQGLDIAGAVTSTAGLVAIVYGLLQAAEHPWESASVVLPLAGGIALLLATLIIERRAKNPLIPLDFFANRTRSVINGTSLFFMAAFISYTFILTLFEQHVLKYSPLETGLAYLPLGFGIGIGIGVGTALTPRVGVRAIVAAGFIGAGVGLLLTSMIDVDTDYVGGILPGMVVFGVCAGATMPAATSAALHQVTSQNSSLASGVQNTMQQIGGALGLAVLVPLAIRYTTSEIQDGVPVEVAVTSGYALAFRVGAALMIIGGVLIMALFERVDPELRDPTSEIVGQTR
ncbi:MFS transporter [Streptomyces sp. NPDC096046]|uniref:MFS transporter n=1 Tax=Streptomyces sp. NPDC096046 TaxID=3155542 RepID=UPI0033220890